MAWHPGKFKGRYLLQLWLAHLAMCASESGRPGSILLASDGRWRLPPLTVDAARKQLGDYCTLYREGLTYPLPVLPEISFSWAQEADKSRARAKALRAWQNQWTGAFGDSADPYLALVIGRLSRLPFNEATFDQLATRLYSGLLETAESI